MITKREVIKDRTCNLPRQHAKPFDKPSIASFSFLHVFLFFILPNSNGLVDGILLSPLQGVNFRVQLVDPL